jgi:hypothetical protein
MCSPLNRDGLPYRATRVTAIRERLVRGPSAQRRPLYLQAGNSAQPMQFDRSPRRAWPISPDLVIAMGILALHDQRAVRLPSTIRAWPVMYGLEIRNRIASAMSSGRRCAARAEQLPRRCAALLRRVSAYRQPCHQNIDAQWRQFQRKSFAEGDNDVHITRRSEWVDKGGLEITLEQWESYAESDSTLPVGGHVVWNIDGRTVRARVFVAREPGAPNEVAAALFWYRGNVSAKNPGPAGVARMVSIAGHFNARGQGDDGEFYDDSGDPI